MCILLTGKSVEKIQRRRMIKKKHTNKDEKAKRREKK